MNYLCKIHTVIIGLFFVQLLHTGCATHKVASHWRNDVIVVDGSEEEWPIAPQYYDEDTNTSIRVMNDAEAVYVCFTTNDESLKRKLMVTGLTLWIDSAGGKKESFGVHLSGAGPRHRVKPDRGDTHQEVKNVRPPQLLLETPQKLGITRLDTIGPLTVTVSEAREMGVHVGAGQPDGRRFVYEYKIRFTAGPSLSALSPGMVMGIGITTEKSDMEKETPPSDGMGRAYRGDRGGMRGGHKPGGGGFRSKEMGEPFEVWIKTSLSPNIL